MAPYRVLAVIEKPFFIIGIQQEHLHLTSYINSKL